jgi:hypothetical protein
VDKKFRMTLLQKKIFITTSLISATDPNVAGSNPSSGLNERKGMKTSQLKLENFPREKDDVFLTELPVWFRNHPGKKVIRVNEIHFIPHTKFVASLAEEDDMNMGNATTNPCNACKNGDCTCECPCCTATYISVGNKMLEAEFLNRGWKSVSAP